MRILIVGLGSIGMRHARNIRHLQPDSEIVALRRSPHDTFSKTEERVQRQNDGEGYVDRTEYELDTALSLDLDAAVVANPAPFHVPIARRLCDAGLDLFIEKPLSSTAVGAKELLETCRRKGLVVQVGYNFRFYEPLRVVKRFVKHGLIGRIWGVRAEAGSYLPHWRPGRDYRESVSARTDLGGGAVLELSHELDYVRWIVGEPTAVRGELRHSGILEVESEVEDLAEIQLEFVDGSVGSVHLNMLQRPPMRRLRIMGTRGVLQCDLLRNRVEFHPVEEEEPQVLFEDANLDRNDMYLQEMDRFLTCVRDGGRSPVPGQDGLKALHIALAAKRSSEEGRKVRL